MMDIYVEIEDATWNFIALFLIAREMRYLYEE